MKKILTTGFCFILLVLAAACNNSFIRMGNNAGPGNGEVTIRISNPAGRTIMPVAPVFSKFELTLQKEGETPVIVTDTKGIEGSGVTVAISEGIWTIILKGYQDILGNDILAAQGSAELNVNSAEGSYSVEIKLEPIAIGGSFDDGLFSFNITLPEGLDTATLALKDSSGNYAEGYDLHNLIDANIGSISLPPGYYDMSIILVRDNQFAGIFEAVHIYSGLESPVIMDMRGISFAEKIYLAGKLGGIRIGTITIANDEAGTDIIKTIDLERDAARRSDFWIIDIPAVNIGKTVYASLEFNGEKTTKAIPALESKGSADVDLNLFPRSVKYADLALWYSEIKAGGNNPEYAFDGNPDTYWEPEDSSGLELDFGFDVTVNFVRLTFNSESGLEYYSEFFPELTVNKFMWNLKDARAIVEFSLYNAADRSALVDAITAAKDNCDSVQISDNGDDVRFSARWVTAESLSIYQTSINSAAEALSNPLLTDADISETEKALAAATAAFNSAKKWGKDSQISAEDFSVQDGYAYKFVVHLNAHPQFKYQIYLADSAGSNGDFIAEKTVDEAGETVVEVPAASGTTKYINIKVILPEDNRKIETIKIGPCMTLGTPVLTLAPEYSYSAITAVWTEAQMADAYRLVYRYSGEPEWTEVLWAGVDAFERNGDNFICTFKPRAYNEVANSGKELQVVVNAVKNFTDNSFDYTSSNVPVKRLVGPAELNISASHALAADFIDVSWDRVPGASGYYVSRRQFNMNNTAATGATVLYYVSSNGAVTADYAVTATASVAGSRFTLRDAYLTDAAYNNYAESYRDQQNDLIQGYPYRYIVIPVINASDMKALDYSNNSYTLHENGEAIKWANAFSAEKTGFAIGFARNVNATKGTYATSGNVNDRIRITWEKPYMLANAGLNYMVYRRAHNSSTWEAFGPTGEMSYIDNPGRGIMYEYAVGILHHVSTGDIRGPSRPDTSSRFIESERKKVNSKGIPALQGFIQNTVRMNNVTRGQDAAANAVFGERVTWNGSGIAYGGSDVNWGVDGYTVYVMNRNISDGWHTAMDNVTTNTVLLTPGNTPSVTVNTSGIGNVTRNVLFVLRDYKHFFKVRSYSVRDDGVKIYSPDPEWTYQYRWGASDAAHIAASEQMQNDFVKWGARQVTTNEFINIAMLYVARGFNRRVGNGWGMSDGSTSASTSRGGSGRVQSLYNHQSFLSIPLLWTFTFHDYRDDLEARTGEWMTFVRLTGQTRAQVSGSLAFPQRYWTEGSNWVNVFGPVTVADGLYRGRLRIGTGTNDSAANLRWNDNRGRVLVEFPLGSGEQNLQWLGSNTPLPFTGQGDDRYQGNDWR